jgi:hypothetical protein
MAMQKQRANVQPEQVSLDLAEELQTPALFDLPALTVLPRLEAALAELGLGATSLPTSALESPARRSLPRGVADGEALLHSRVQALLEPMPPQFDQSLFLAFPLNSSRRLFTPAEDR